MPAVKATLRTLYKLFNNAIKSREPVLHRSQLNTGKKDESKTLLSSDARPTTCLTIKDIPGPKPSIPFIGTSWQYFPGGRYSLANLHEAAFDKYMRYGPIMKEEFQWRKPVVHLFDPDDFAEIFYHPSIHPKRPISEFLTHYRRNHPDKYDSVGIANSEGAEWKKLRDASADELLKPINLMGLVKPIDTIGDDFISLLRAKRDPETHVIENFQDLGYRLALEGVYYMSLDSRLGCLKHEVLENTPAHDMIQSVLLLFEAFQKLFYSPALWKICETPSYKKLHKAESVMYDMTSKRIEEKMEYVRRNPTQHGKQSILEILLGKKCMTDKERKVTIIDFISGGIFTVTNASTFLVYHVSRNPEVQQKLYEEVMRVMPTGEITYEAIDRMPYLWACLKESFRLTPTIPCIARILDKDITLSGYLIPAGTPIFCNFMVPSKQADRFPEPERFNPDRWLRSRLSRANPFTVLPFGHGHRMCIGKRFAEIEMCTLLAKMIYNFEIGSTGQEVKCKQAFIVVPSHAVSIILKDRKQKT